MLLGGGGVVECGEKARSVHGLLVDPVDGGRFGQPDRRQDGGGDVDAVGELPAHLCVGGDSVRPRDDHRVAVPAEVAGHLLAPLERSVVRVRPGGGEVRSGMVAAERLDPAVFVDQPQLVFGVEYHPLRKVISLNEPVTVPSMLAPLSPQM